MTAETEIKHLQALNMVLADCNKSQSQTIRELKHIIIIICISFTLIICALIGGFTYYESQFETTETATTVTTLETDGEDADIYSVTDGDMYNDNAVHNE